MKTTFAIHNENCLSILRTMDSQSVDVVVTDPPYGIDGSRGAKNIARGKGNYQASFPDTPEYIQRVVIEAILQCRRIARAVIVTPGIKNMMLYPQPDSFGVFYQPAAVGLQTFGNLDAQPIFYYGKNATGKNMGVPCSHSMTSKADESIHPCRKPTKEWTRLILAHTLPGQTVLDPFMGSGTTGEVCVKNGRNFIGIELEKLYFEEAKSRIENAVGMYSVTENERKDGKMMLFDFNL